MEANNNQQREKRALGTEAARKIPGIAKQMLAQAQAAKAEGKPVAYCLIDSLYDEIVRSMDITPLWTENYAGVTAAKRDAERFLNKAESQGFSRSLCTYATCCLGLDAWRDGAEGLPPDAPWGGMPKPDMMLGSGTEFCDPRYKWFQAAQRYLDVPVYVIGLPWPAYDLDIDLEAALTYYARYIVEQLKGLVSFLEKQTDKKMDWDRLSVTIDLADRTYRMWWQAYELRKAIPTPMGTEDAMNTMVPGWFMMGTQEAFDFYRDLYEEVKYRVENKIGLVPEEKYRILWGGGLPPWFALKDFDYFKSKGAVFPIEVMYRPFEPPEILGLDKNVRHPLERLAWRWLRYQTFRYKKAQRHPGSHPDVELLIDFIENFGIDGVMMHEAFSCRSWHVGLLWQLNLLKKLYRPLPSLILQSDIVDARSYSEVETKERIDAFVEMLERVRRAGGHS